MNGKQQKTALSFASSKEFQFLLTKFELEQFLSPSFLSSGAKFSNRRLLFSSSLSLTFRIGVLVVSWFRQRRPRAPTADLPSDYSSIADIFIDKTSLSFLCLSNRWHFPFVSCLNLLFAALCFLFARINNNCYRVVVAAVVLKINIKLLFFIHFF